MLPRANHTSCAWNHLFPEIFEARGVESRRKTQSCPSTCRMFAMTIACYNTALVKTVWNSIYHK